VPEVGPAAAVAAAVAVAVAGPDSPSGIRGLAGCGNRIDFEGNASTQFRRSKGDAMLKNKYDRRQFMQQVGGYGIAGIAAIAGLTALSGCGGEKEAEKVAAKPHNAISAAKEAADPCNDVSTLTRDELATRTTFKYEAKATDATKPCDTCNFWEPAAEGDLCGGCTLVKGPIHPLGSCMSWVEKIKT